MDIKEFFSIFKSLEFPHILTLVHLVLGMISILFAVTDEYLFASAFMIGAVIIDLLDDKVAKFMKKDTAFGFSLERVAGLVSYGVAPVVLAFQTTRTVGTGWIFAVIIYIVFLIAVALQTSRMHVQRNEPNYEGMPVFVNGLLVPVFYLVGVARWYPLVLLLAALLMVCSFKVKKIF